MLTQSLANETVLFFTHEDLFAKLPNKPNKKKAQHVTLPSSTAHL